MCSSDLRRVFDSLPLAISVFDKNLRFVAVSQAWEREKHTSSNDVIGKSLYTWMPYAHSKWLESYEKCLAGEVGSLDIRDTFTKPDGSQESVHRRVVPLLGHGGEIEGILMVVESI